MFKKIRSMTYDKLSNLLQIVGGGVLTVTFIVGLLTIWVQIQASKEKDTKAKEQEKTISEINLKVQQEILKRIEAETKLVELQERITWRYFDHDKFVAVLRLSGKGSAEIVFSKEDNESYSFAQSIWMALLDAGWDVKQPVSGKNEKENNANIPFGLREGGIITSDIQRVVIAVSEVTESKPYNNNTPLSGLLKAMEIVGVDFIQTIPYEGMRPPKGVVRIVVGSRL